VGTGDHDAAMTASAHDVARELRRRLGHAGDVKIHKLLYYCQGWHLAWFGDPAFSEVIEAWANGPVVEALWRDEKYGRSVPDPHPLNGAVLGTVEYVVSRYGNLTGKELIRLTHEEDPWRDVSESIVWSEDIEHDALIRFFKSDEDAEHASGFMTIAAAADSEIKHLLDAARARTTTGSVDDPQEIRTRLQELSRR
jgi:uncharacterized phage-associated protein